MMMKLNLNSQSSYGVLGLGESGSAVVACLRHHGCGVRVWDDDATRMKSHANHLKASDFDTLNGIIVSAGIAIDHDPQHPMVRKALKRQCPVLRDVALLHYAQSAARRVAVTGTDGKSSVIALLAAIFERAAIPHAVGGNSFCGCLAMPDLPPEGCYLVELSSYQLESKGETAWDVAVLLNVSEDHLQRHGSMARYAATKARIFDHMNDNHLCVVGCEDAQSDAIAQALQDNHRAVRRFGENATSHHDAHRELCRMVARWFGVADDVISDAIGNFKGLPHRMETVVSLDASSDQRVFINDSKATNPHATAAALASCHNIFWICGGLHKNVSFEPLAPYVHRVERAYVVGRNQESLCQWLDEKAVAYQTHDSQRDALRAALAHSETMRATILLSPAAASQDEWQDFAQRGDAFRHDVHQLTRCDS